MKKPVREISEAELKAKYPIKGSTLGWYFRLTETSNGAWKIEGSDKWSRKITLTGADEIELLSKAETESTRIKEKQSTS